MAIFPVLTIEPKETETEAEKLALPLSFEEFKTVGKDQAGTTKERNNTSERKSRAFSAYLVSYLCADSLWPGGAAGGNTIRPIWLRLAGSEQELRAFVANLQSGYKASLQETDQPFTRSITRIELLKRAGYRFIWQKVELDGRKMAVVTAYLPQLLRLDPGMVDPVMAEFVLMPPQWWLLRETGNLSEAQLQPVFNHASKLGILKQLPKPSASSTKGKGKPVVGDNSGQDAILTKVELVQWLPVAAYFAAYLDRRTTRPLPDSLGFYCQLLFSAMREGFAVLAKANSANANNDKDKWEWARTKTGFYAFGLENSETFRPLLFSANQQKLDSFLATQLRVYFGLKQGLTLPEILRELDQAKDSSSTNNQKAS